MATWMRNYQRYITRCGSTEHRRLLADSVAARYHSKTSEMSAMTFLLLVLGVTALSEGRSLVFENRRRDTVWVGTLGSAERGTLKGGGWEMRPGSLVTINMDDGWTGRFWGRTGCLFDGYGHGRCQTGDCGRRLQCNGTSGQPPVTFAEVNLGGWGSQDFYSISLVDGFNIPITIEPIDKQGGGDRYRCYPASCPTDINALCPSKLRSDGGCKSACLAFNTDQYCCRGRFSSAQACRSSSWPRNYPAFFKGLCPDAYSYPYDDDRSTFTCEKTAYRIIFS
ncbi:pathogenesis-related protein 5-like isoform X1 [Schistocerca americana]|uniref:pathogenesis-related protein 5-like isoform X1 n=2 Tax=Schistocerca americana TaxID=7009 RepID=UPI001F4FBBB6|nr:pathogenesis-related protein 5-like isoform X1 [Schistocerca americana]XP_047117664.1 pathogenesis-related protein 5-like isoform X1 [Schistocerca piceifrons]XP_047117666.1 pathogenesis-related protein 5-like isoform X1 [Schistocerca piceifrons]XP_047117667.1 pathogenesis-related protein 5-like isoform X1 [Schistocerca piceifrons]